PEIPPTIPSPIRKAKNRRDAGKASFSAAPPGATPVANMAAWREFTSDPHHPRHAPLVAVARHLRLEDVGLVVRLVALDGCLDRDLPPGPQRGVGPQLRISLTDVDRGHGRHTAVGDQVVPPAVLVARE